MAQALTEAALREALTKIGLVSENLQSLDLEAGLPALRFELQNTRLRFDQLHFLSLTFDTWMISVEGYPGFHGYDSPELLVTISVPERPISI